MIRLLKAFVDWLEKRFPAKVFVTEQWIETIDTRLESYAFKIAILNDKINQIEHDISTLKKQKEEAKPVSNPKRTFIETGDISLLK